MKRILLSLLAPLCLILSAKAQTAEEVVANYFDAIGGEAKIGKVTTTKTTCTANAQGMEFPVIMYQKAPNKQRIDMTFQGQTMTQMCFDGNEGWSTNFMTMKPEKFEAEDSEIMKGQFDFPMAFYQYTEKGHTVSKETDEDIEGTSCHVIKLTRKPIMIDGKEEENATYYFFDKETAVPIMSRQFGMKGPSKGQPIETFLGDYQEVDGIFFPHSITQKAMGQTMFYVKIDSMELNANIADDFFAMPVINE
jgi:hypothetical protein